MKKPKFSLTEVSQEINLSELLGREPTPTEKEAFISEAIDLMIERTQSGVDLNGKKFKPYTKEYAEFKGVSRGDVDLTLFGSMLSSLDGAADNDSVTLFINDETETAKAFGHISGFEGHPTIPNGKYKRKFFGINENEAELIAAKIEEAPVRELARIVEERNNFDITSIIQGIGLRLG